MTTAIFMVDLLAPLWYDVWVLYLIPLFFMYQSAKRPYVYSAIVTLLIAVGLFLSPSDIPPFMHAAANRITGIFGGWGVSVLLMRLKRLHVSLLQAHNELEKHVEVKAIVSSGYSNDPVMTNFEEHGFKAVVTKPFKSSDLSRILHKVITET